MAKAISQFIMWLTGWKVEGTIPDDLKKAVIIAAPHTTYWDFFYARLAFFIIGMPLRVTVKKEVVNAPFYGWILRGMGAIAIDRTPKAGNLKKRPSMVDAMVDIIHSHEQMIMMVTPEGTRKYVPRWKTGFYRVAEEAGVPIILGFLDYSTKTAGIGPVYYPSGNYDKDIIEIQSFYRTKKGKYPELGVR